MPEVILPCPECGDDECLIVVQEFGSGEWSVHCGCGHAGRYCVSEEEAIKAHNALPRALRWTHEPPKVAGGYLVRQRKHESETGWSYPIFIEVKFAVGYFQRLEWVQYAGPIPAPID